MRPAITGHSTEKITRSVIRNRVTCAPRDRVYGISDLDRKLIFEVNISVPVSRDALATAECSAKAKRVTRFAIAS